VPIDSPSWRPWQPSAAGASHRGASSIRLRGPILPSISRMARKPGPPKPIGSNIYKLVGNAVRLGEVETTDEVTAAAWVAPTTKAGPFFLVRAPLWQEE
jgi:hypothetical protein